MHRALRETAGPSALRRAAIGAVFALSFSACQTPFTAAVLRERIETLPEASAAPAVAPTATVAAPSPSALANPQREVARPKLAERLAELLVRHAPDLTPVDRARVAAAIDSAQQAHQIDPLLLLAIIEQESAFEPRARGVHGSVGLMQIKSFVARDVAKRHGIPWSGPRTLLDPAANVSIGACYLGEMFEMFPDPALAIAAYNLGPYRVQRLVARGQTPRPKYLTSVLARFQVFAGEFGPAEPESVEDADAE
ncbi:MAG: lytic transglycosylase domain-containing protein [Myxococcota bacterium]